MGPWHRNRDPKTVSDFDELTRQLNLRRILYVSAGVLIFELLNLINHPFQQNWYTVLGFVLILAVVSVFPALIIVWRRKLLRRPAAARLVMFLFWGLLYLAVLPFFIHDLQNMLHSADVTPINLTLFCIMLTVLPIFTPYEMLACFSVFLVGNLVVAAVFSAPPAYYAYTVALCVTSLIFSYATQYQYLRMIWELKVANRVDPLTEILNKKAGIDKMHTVMSTCKRSRSSMAVYMIDIDDFKKFNDCYGHLQGDRSLKAVGKTLAGVFSRESDVVFRYGGEEFVVATPLVDPSEIDNRTAALNDAIRRLNIRMPYNSASEYLTLSIGSTVYRPDMDSPTIDALALVDRADAEMYRVKAAKRDSSGFNSESGRSSS